MKDLKIGTSHKAEGSLKELDLAFPVLVEIENLTPKKIILPSLPLVIPPHGKNSVEVSEIDSLTRSITDLDSHAAMNRYEHSVTLRFQEKPSEGDSAGSDEENSDTSKPDEPNTSDDEATGKDGEDSGTIEADKESSSPSEAAAKKTTVGASSDTATKNPVPRVKTNRALKPAANKAKDNK